MSFLLFHKKLYNTNTVNVIEKIDDLESNQAPRYGIILHSGMKQEYEWFKTSVNRNSRFDSLCVAVGAENERGY